MPGYITHNIFGRKEYKIMKEGILKQSIRKHRNAFYVGLQGPDIFFYFPKFFLINRKNLGSIMHTSKTGEYMSKMLEYILNTDNTDREICMAYFCGFLGHYSLDRTCHPYIYWKTDIMHKTKDYHAKHVALETDIDYIFCKEFYKKSISDFPYKSIAEMNEKEMEVISGMLSEVLQNTYKYIKFDNERAYSVLLSFKYVIGCITDIKGIKEKVVGGIEEKLIGHKHFATLFIRDNYIIKNNDCLNLSKAEWFNPWKQDIKENSNFYELTELAGVRYQSLMKLLERIIYYAGENSSILIENKSGLNADNMKSVKKLFIEEVGNKSFLTGLTLD